MSVYKSKNEIPTIDVNMVTIEPYVGEGETAHEFGFETANQIQLEPQTEETESVKLVVKGNLISQKPQETTITGNQITLTDNVFNPELVLVLQGGIIEYELDPVTSEPTNVIKKYTPPVAGSNDKGERFKLHAYSAVYNAAGQITKYEKITYPNCTGNPVAFNSEDGVFRAPEYIIKSAPNTGEAPYEIEYVASLPTLVDPT